MDMRHAERRPPLEAARSLQVGALSCRDAAANAFSLLDARPLLDAWEAQGKAYIEYMNAIYACFGASSLLLGLSWTKAHSRRRLDLDGAMGESGCRPVARGFAARDGIGPTRLFQGAASAPAMTRLEPAAAPIEPPADAAAQPQVALVEPTLDVAPTTANLIAEVLIAEVDFIGEWDFWRRGATDPRL